MKVICLDDSNRPNEIPITRWIKKGKCYNIHKVTRLLTQNVLGVKLKEINNDDLMPWSYFLASRFIPVDLIDNINIKTELILEKAIKDGELEFEEL